MRPPHALAGTNAPFAYHRTPQAQVRAEKLPFGVIGNSAISNFILRNRNPLIRSMRTHMRQYPSFAASVAALRAGDVDAVMSPQQLVQFAAAQPPCELAVLPELMNTAFWAFALPLTIDPEQEAAWNAAIVATIDDGTLSGLLSRYLHPTTNCDVSIDVSTGGTGVSIDSYAGSFQCQWPRCLLTRILTRHRRNERVHAHGILRVDESLHVLLL